MSGSSVSSKSEKGRKEDLYQVTSIVNEGPRKVQAPKGGSKNDEASQVEASLTSGGTITKTKLIPIVKKPEARKQPDSWIRVKERHPVPSASSSKTLEVKKTYYFVRKKPTIKGTKELPHRPRRVSDASDTKEDPRILADPGKHTKSKKSSQTTNEPDNLTAFRFVHAPSAIELDADPLSFSDQASYVQEEPRGIRSSPLRPSLIGDRSYKETQSARAYAEPRHPSQVEQRQSYGGYKKSDGRRETVISTGSDEQNYATAHAASRIDSGYASIKAPSLANSSRTSLAGLLPGPARIHLPSSSSIGAASRPRIPSKLSPKHPRSGKEHSAYELRNDSMHQLSPTASTGATLDDSSDDDYESDHSFKECHRCRLCECRRNRRYQRHVSGKQL